jgi:hypothetical protein
VFVCFAFKSSAVNLIYSKQLFLFIVLKYHLFKYFFRTDIVWSYNVQHNDIQHNDTLRHGPWRVSLLPSVAFYSYAEYHYAECRYTDWVMFEQKKFEKGINLYKTLLCTDLKLSTLELNKLFEMENYYLV